MTSGMDGGRTDQDVIRLAALGLTTTGIVHDFGNLMQIVISAIHLIERNLDQPMLHDVRTFTQGALASVDRATALSRQILGFSRLKDTTEEIVYLDSALAAIKKPICWMAGQAIRVELAVSDDLLPVFCNVREFENAVLNLAINAKDAMSEGGRLRISAFRAGSENEPIVVLRVTDTGCGMSPEIAKQAFQPFFTTKPAGSGNGLGLAMVGEFVRRVGGSVQIESAVNRGTSIVMRLSVCRN